MPVELPAELFESLRGISLMLMGIDAKLVEVIHLLGGGEDEEEADA